MKKIYFLSLAMLFCFALNVSAQSSIKTGNAPGSVCACAGFNLSFTVTGTFNAGNVFTAQLSNEAGNFSNAVEVGTLTGTTGGNIPVTIPCNTVQFGNYRLRVVSSAPVVTGSVSVNFSPVPPNTPPTVTITPHTATLKCVGGISGGNASIHVSSYNSGTAPTYIWYLNGNVVPGATGSMYTAMATEVQEGDKVYCVMTSNSSCASQPVATSPEVTIEHEAPIKVEVTPATCGSNDGKIVLTDSAFGFSSFHWSNGATTTSLTNLQAGVYNVTADFLGICENIRRITVGSTSSIVFTETHTNPDCNQVNGSIDITVTDGKPPIVYIWSNGDTREDIANLAASTYSITIADGLGCTTSKNIAISDADGPQVTLTPVNPTCTGSNGSITATVTGGVQPYTYSWGGTVAGNVNTIDNLPTGDYNVEVTDQAGCKGYGNLALNNSNNHLVITATTAKPSCGTHGGIELTVTGGTQPYSYHWSNGETINPLTNVQSGWYYVTVTDAGSCSANKGVNVAFSFYVYLSSTPANCTDNGTVTANPKGGVPPYTYQWNTTPLQTTAEAANLAAGEYTVTVTDSLGCTVSAKRKIGMDCHNVIKGRIYADKNGNCIFDAGDEQMIFNTVYAESGNKTYYGYTGFDGLYEISVPATGAYTLKVHDIGFFFSSVDCGVYTLCGNSSGIITIGSMGTISGGNNFAFQPTSGYNLALHPGWKSAKPGFEKEYWLLPHNHSSTPFTGTATVVFKYDENLVFKSSSVEAMHDVNAHTLTWEITDVPSPYYNWNERIICRFTVPASLPLLYLLQSDFSISPTGDDCDSSDNFLHTSEVVTGAVDPNEKEVFPAGSISPNDSVLTYSIHFQNTGNDTTDFVIVTDTLSSWLEPASARTVASSHPYEQFRIEGEGVLTWVFSPIYLVDSMTNEPESKGFVTFEVKKKKDAPIGTIIKNKAEIYFDYNAAVVTNTVSSSVLLTGEDKINDASGKLKVYPNPTDGIVNVRVAAGSLPGNAAGTIVVTDVLGRVVATNTIKGTQATIDLNALPPGVFTIQVNTAGETLKTKVVKH